MKLVMIDVLRIVILFFPWKIKKFLYQKIFSYEIEADCRIGLTYLNVNKLVMRNGSSIGSFTVIRNINNLELGSFSKIGTFNWIFGASSLGDEYFSDFPDRDSKLVIGTHSAITSRHLIDCTDTIWLGSYVTVAGFRSQLLTHSINLRNNTQECAPISIGDYSFIGTGVIILKGVKLAERTAISAGSVITKSITNSGGLYSGNPNTRKLDLDVDNGYFVRTKGRV